MIRVQLNDPNTGDRFAEYFVRATDDEVRAALHEDGAAAVITVEVYTRAVSTIRGRQAAAKAAKDTAMAELARAADTDAAVAAAKCGVECPGDGAGAESSTSTDAGNGIARGVVPWQKRARTS